MLRKTEANRHRKGQQHGNCFQKLRLKVTSWCTVRYITGKSIISHIHATDMHTHTHTHTHMRAHTHTHTRTGTHIDGHGTCLPSQSATELLKYGI